MKPEQQEPKYWRYDAGDGWTVFAGKTDEDNDLLSLQFALPDDYWFHVATLPGSHVLLRAPEGFEGDAPKEKLLFAAGIALWHSKARNAGRTPVDCTRAKFVSKPRHAKPGLVTISHETTMRAYPVSPAPTQESQNSQKKRG